MRGARLGVLLLAGLVLSSAVAGVAMKFGVDHRSVDDLEGLGVRADYAAFWAGPWNERAGWDYLGRWADEAADRGAKPVVHWFYWGNDISPGCVRDGCWGSGHWKDRATWARDAAKLADALHRGLQGRPGLLVLETEFNKNGIGTWESFDGYLASHAKIFRERAPELKLVLGFGNWEPWNWARFDRAAAASDVMGFQTMRASTRDSVASYLGAVDAIERATKQLRATFPGKPVLLYDLALSTHWEPEWGAYQERVLKELFARADKLEGMGLVGIVYRALDDDPTFTTSEYYRIAERHMGLRRADGSWKPALNDVLAGVRAMRGDPALASPSAPSAAFTPKSLGNPWWVEVRVAGTPDKVDAKVGDGAWRVLERTAWGTWADSFWVPAGAKVQFRAWDGGASTLSPSYAWGEAARFEPRSVGNDWWVDVKVTGLAPDRVDARVDSGLWVPLPRTAWGTWAASVHAPDGARVTFRAVDGGAVHTSAPTTWT